jgi:hypothetical protein
MNGIGTVSHGAPRNTKDKTPVIHELGQVADPGARSPALCGSSIIRIALFDVLVLLVETNTAPKPLSRSAWESLFALTQFPFGAESFSCWQSESPAINCAPVARLPIYPWKT